MTIDDSKLKKAVDLTMASNGGRGISLWSRDGARVLRYFENTIVGFSKGIAAADVLEEMVEAAYPEIWNAVSDYIPPADGMQVQCPMCGKWYTPKYAAHNQKTKQVMPTLGDIDRDELKAVEIELEKRSNCLISVYNSRVSATMRYLSLTETKFSMSKTAAELLERGLEKMYPGFFTDEIVNSLSSITEKMKRSI